MQRPGNLTGESRTLGLIKCKRPGETSEDCTGPTINSRAPPKRAVSEELDRVETVAFGVGLSFDSARARMHRCKPNASLALFHLLPISLNPTLSFQTQYNFSLQIPNFALYQGLEFKAYRPI